MKWIKRGVIYTNPQRAQMPTALVMPDRIRIYYNIRDERLRARCHFIDVNKETMKVIGESKKEVLPLGKLGAFDDAGVMPGAVYYENNLIYLYYCGISLAKDVPYKVAIGRANSLDGVEFSKLGLDIASDYLVTTPFCTPNYGIASYGKGWSELDTKPEPIYQIPGLPIRHNLESTCRPAIIEINHVLHMWFSYRDHIDFRGGAGSYRMGYATSKGGEIWVWKRDDSKAGIDIGAPGEFDSEMICYPNIVKVGKKYIIFYNGNFFGGSGIGYAEVEE